MVDYNSCDSPYSSDEQHIDENSLNIIDTLRSFKEEIRCCKVDNDWIIQSQEIFSIGKISGSECSHPLEFIIFAQTWTT